MEVYTAGYLENGLGFLIAPRPGAHLVHLAAYLDHGVKDETPEENGISHLIEHLLFNVHRFPKHLASAWQELAQKGVYLEAWTGKEHTRLSLSCNAEQLRQALRFVRQLLKPLPIRQEAFDHERSIVMDEIARKRSSPEYLWNLIEEALYAPPYGLPVLGTPETVASIKLEDLRRKLHQVLAPVNLRLVLVGRCSAGVADAVYEMFSTWTAGKASSASPPIELAQRVMAIRGPGSRVKLYLAFPVPGLADKERYAVEILAHILGRGMASRVFRSLREEVELAYAVGGGSVHWRQSGYLFLAADLARERLDEGFRNLLKAATSLQTTPLLEEEVVSAREALALQALHEAEGPGLAYRLGVHWLAGEIYYPTQAASVYRQVSLSEVHAAARYLDPRHMALLGIGIHEDELARLLEVSW
ncbi:MAG: insulinase family protein [Truepera sp.]|nr:insulinase family protein [Truepera sp.]MBS3967513.1 insulinase family protein [Truepera sp.]